MRRALIGHSGFVGGNLARQMHFDELFNSANIGEIRGRSFDEIWCAGVPAVKWAANKDPEGDERAIGRLMEPLLAARTGALVLISTVDVFDPAVDVDESTPVRTDGLHPYGLHRYQVERKLAAHFKTTVVRLSGLFGRGLKKNAIYDLIKGNNLSQLDSRAVYQFYLLDHLGGDIALAREAGIRLLHLASEPVGIAEVAEALLGRPFVNLVSDRPARYDFKSLHAGLWSAKDYRFSKAQVLAQIKDFGARALPEGLLGAAA